MPTSFRTIVSLTALIACLSPILWAGQEEGETVHSDFDRFLMEVEFNGAVLIAREGEVIFKKAYGIADADGEIPLTTKSSINLASVSKQFTATGIMILMERGKLKLDDPVSKYLPQLAYAEGISIRHLLHHTSGLPDIYDMLFEQWDRSNVAGNEDLLRLFREQEPATLFEPGEKMEYSNTGYIILASVIEAISKQPLERFMEENVFEPLGMSDSFVYYKNMKAYPRARRVWGLRRDADGIDKHDLIFCDGMRGDGNVHSSVEDLFKWDRALYTDRLLKKESRDMMFTQGRLNDGSAFPYGFGWGVNLGTKSGSSPNPLMKGAVSLGPSVSHGGAWVGFRSLIIRYLDSEDTIIVLMNLIPPKPDRLAEEIKIRFFTSREE